MDRKSALLEQRVLSHQNGFLPDTGTATDTYFLNEAGRGWKIQVELGVTRITGIGRCSFRISGREIKVVAVPSMIVNLVLK